MGHRGFKPGSRMKQKPVSKTKMKSQVESGDLQSRPGGLAERLPTLVKATSDVWSEIGVRQFSPLRKISALSTSSHKCIRGGKIANRGAGYFRILILVKILCGRSFL